jgi:hypothetical protein
MRDRERPEARDQRSEPYSPLTRQAGSPAVNPTGNPLTPGPEDRKTNKQCYRKWPWAEIGKIAHVRDRGVGDSATRAR